MQNHYPLWKNLLLIGLFVIGLVYAAPNLFPDDPAVQISSASMETASDLTVPRIQQILDNAKLPYISVVKQAEGILVRFQNTETQINARDIIKATLGENYTVAINLASRTPKWLVALGAHPMKMGLDLSGGVHFLLQVDLDRMIKAREDGDLRSIASDLREDDVRYIGLTRIQPRGIAIKFRDADSLNKGFDKLSSRLQDYTITKSTTGGDFQLRVQMSDKAVFSVADYAIDQTMNIMRKRVNALGVSEAVVTREGTNNISVDLPGIQDSARAKEIIGKTATLKFQMVDIEHDAESAAAGDVPIGTKLYTYEGRHVLLKNQVILQGSSITYASASFAQDGRPSVNVHLGGGGESTFNSVTAENIGKPMAVVYIEYKSEQQMIDGKPVTVMHPEEKIISVATIQSALGSNFEITGLQSVKYAQNLALLLRSGALQAPVSIISELTVGPSMGKANVTKGEISIIVGFIFVVLFMVFYYYFFGIVADMALLLNLIFIVAILSILGATMTLPGMAAMVLTVAMAVDANVLIYERIREELRNGISPQASIFAGYERALPTIIDSNVTTLIVAVVLFALGTGPIKGFAVVLTVGIMTSMLTAIVFTRGIVNFVYGHRNVKTLSIGIKSRLG